MSKPPSVSRVTSGLTDGRPTVADGRRPTMPFSGTCVRNVYLKFTGTRLPAMPDARRNLRLSTPRGVHGMLYDAENFGKA